MRGWLNRFRSGSGAIHCCPNEGKEFRGAARCMENMPSPVSPYSQYRPMHIKLVSRNDAESLSKFHEENREHLVRWEPIREDGYNSISAWRERLIAREKEQEEGRSAYFVACQNDGEVIALCSLTNIVRGPFQACYMGFAVSRSFQGQGLMRQLCRHTIEFAFNELGLNRIKANYMPCNERSGALLKSLGFEEEGLARKYLKINGNWEDHVLTSLVNPKSK